ncbi:MAG TPA: hypothetical protein VMS32_01185 [Verrucomicrobiae bacterium]|jgi:uncharacterized membrane protein HdeD (DUF308 family)|nr:hypothetical protein [Verrucomicrobiae bacterium]
MITTVKSLNWFIRLDGLVLVVLGILFWTGNAPNLVMLHMALGALLVLALWLLAIAAAFARAPLTSPILALIWGALALWLGLTQDSLLLGSPHWIVQTLHLLVGIGAIGIAQWVASSLPGNRRAT